AVEKALPGQVVTLRGKCQPGAGLTGWAIVQVKGDPPAPLAAEDLVKQALADDKGLTARLKGKYVVVTGVVTEVKNDGRTLVLADPDKRPRVTVAFHPESPTFKGRAKPHQVGDKVKVVGTSLLGDPSFVFCDDLSDGG